MKPLVAPLLLAPDVEEICRLGKQVPEPANYFLGFGKPEGVLPGKILCFVRHQPRELVGEGQAKASQHHRCVLLIAARGSGRLCLDADQFALDEAQAQFVSPFQFHSYIGVHPDICWVFITFEILDPKEIEPLRSRPSVSLGPTELVLVREILQCWICEERRSLLPHHLGLLLRRLCATPLELAAPSASNLKADLIGRVNRYAMSRLNESLRLKEVAAALGESESHLRAKFRQATGGSLGQHLRQLRLQKACQLLHTSDLSLAEISEHCGFDTVYSFSRTFKNGCGVPPRAYRMGLRYGLQPVPFPQPLG